MRNYHKFHHFFIFFVFQLEKHEFARNLLEIISLHLETTTNFSEISQLLNDLYESLEIQGFEAENLKKDEERICKEVAIKIDEILGLLDFEIDKSNGIIEEIEKSSEVFVEGKQRFEKEKRILERNLKEKTKNLEEKKNEEKNCENWKKREEIVFLQRFFIFFMFFSLFFSLFFSVFFSVFFSLFFSFFIDFFEKRGRKRDNS